MKININQNTTKSISEKIEDYVGEKSSPEESHELESLALDDDFTADAMEGLAAFPNAISSIPEFQKGKNYTGIYVVGFTILVSALIWFMVMNPFSEKKNTLVQNINKKEVTTQNSENKITKNQEITQENSPSERNNSSKENNKIIKTETTQKSPKREYFELQKEELNPLKWENKKEYDLAKTKTKIIGFHNFLAVDYSVIYTNSQNFETELNGIRANRENKETQPDFGEKNVSKNTFSYKEYLKESLGYLEDKNYTLAIENFQIILKHYPEDVNAQFYLGYIYYHKNEFEKSVTQMNKVIANSFDFFREDAEWYKANALQKLGKLKKAAVLLKKIKAEGGYYSYQVKS